MEAGKLSRTGCELNRKIAVKLLIDSSRLISRYEWILIGQKERKNGSLGGYIIVCCVSDVKPN